MIEEMTKVEAETESSLSCCIGPGCPKHALPESVYCSTDCIVQHAAATMKTLSDSKEPKLKARPQRKAATKVIPKVIDAHEKMTYFPGYPHFL